MGLLGRLFGKRATPANDMCFSRGPKAVHAKPGTEEATFLREAGAILGCEGDAIDPSKGIQSDYGCGELDVFELIQIAEDVWGVSLMPAPFTAEDAESAVKKYRTLSHIVDAAKARRGM
ncbi:MAG: hypothetical protein ACYTEL_22860 [Planctomycetota bacterium]